MALAASIYGVSACDAVGDPTAMPTAKEITSTGAEACAHRPLQQPSMRAALESEDPAPRIGLRVGQSVVASVDGGRYAVTVPHASAAGIICALSVVRVHQSISVIFVAERPGQVMLVATTSHINAQLLNLIFRLNVQVARLYRLATGECHAWWSYQVSVQAAVGLAFHQAPSARPLRWPYFSQKNTCGIGACN